MKEPELSEDLAQKILRLARQMYIVDINESKKLLKKIKVKSLDLSNEKYKSEGITENYLRNTITSQKKFNEKEVKIDIVLESSPNSEKYFHSFIELTKQIISEY